MHVCTAALIGNMVNDSDILRPWLGIMPPPYFIQIECERFTGNERQSACGKLNFHAYMLTKLGGRARSKTTNKMKN